MEPSDRKDPMLPTPRLIVIGASAGGIEALGRFLPGFSADVPAAMALVLHRAAIAEDERLPHVLSRFTSVPVQHAREGDELVPGRLVVAPADLHLTVDANGFHLDAGPRINAVRPSIDRLFFSAATAFGSAVTAVVLSGLLNDGVAGAALVKARGGHVLVQDPADALFDGMPRAAQRHASPDLVASAATLGGAAARSVMSPSPTSNVSSSASASALDAPGLTCPECGGVLTEHTIGDLPRFRCRVGHEYAVASLFHNQDRALENALYTALRVLDERAELTERLVRRMHDRGFDRAARRLEGEMRDVYERARVVRRALGDPSLRQRNVGITNDVADVEG